MKLSRGHIALIVILAVIIIDQAVKIWVKTHFYLGESYEVTSWFKIHFIENNGMAFGWELGSKLMLTLFRVVLTALLIVYMCKLSKRPGVKTGYMVCLALITAGAIGNIIDCAFYGLIFNNPAPPQVATLLPPDGGYGTFLHGRVVDMLYFPLCRWYWPEWLPWIGGERFEFFQPVFNIADAAISVGIIALLLFYRNSLSANDVTPEPKEN
ncbi:MAG: lipoprotein signal peptidase [Muribaculaceae bacterium]|nr:lipoprotein signal peptidase [Muribaculaceae bacterium]